MAKIEPFGSRPASRLSLLIERLLHPLVIVAVSMLVAGGTLLSGVEVLALAKDAESLLKLIGGALLLVLIAVFFQQQTQIRQERSNMKRHFVDASGQLDRMISALEDRKGKSETVDRLETES